MAVIGEVPVVDLGMDRGDEKVIKVTFTDNTDAPIDDAGAVYRLSTKKSLSDPDGLVVFSVTAHQTTPGVAFLTIPSSATSGFVSTYVGLEYDIKVTETSGRITTVQKGTLLVSPNVSAATI